MAINQPTLAQVQQEILSLGTQMNALFTRIQMYNTFIAALGTAGLQAAPYSLSSGDATTLFSAAADLDNFRKVYSGLMYVTSGATVNTGTPTNNDGTHFGYPFGINVGKIDGFGY
jgi:hypothetical protein